MGVLMVESRGTSKLREMNHRLHLLMEYPDDKNTGLTPSVKNGVPLVIVAANPIGDLLTHMPHERRAGQEVKGALQVIGVVIGLASTKVKQGIFVDSSEILRRKFGELIQDVSASPVRQYRAETSHFLRFVPQLLRRILVLLFDFPDVRASARLNARLHSLSRSVRTQSIFQQSHRVVNR